MFFSRFDCHLLLEKILKFWKWGLLPWDLPCFSLAVRNPPPPPCYVVVYGASKFSKNIFTCCSSCRLQEVLSNYMSCVAFERTRTPNEACVIKGSLPFCKNYALLVKTNMLVKTNTAIVFVCSCLKIILAWRGYALGIQRRCHQATKYCFYSKTEERSDKVITNGMTYSLLTVNR